MVDLLNLDTYHLHEADSIAVIHNYLTRYSTGIKDSVILALEALETQLETVDNTKTIRAVDIVMTRRDREQCIGYALYDT